MLAQKQIHASQLRLGQISHAMFCVFDRKPCGVFSGPYFPIFGLNMEIDLDTSHAVYGIMNIK